jgi:Transglycosylase SLT domain
MATNAPNSYKDPYWSDLAMATESKLGLPEGLLASIVTKGERTNADQVSEAGAKTPFQIIPATRDAAIKKYGIDPYLNPQNAAEVAGLLLKEGITRNKGDVSAAVAEYHGGTNRANWGPKTRSYVARVLGDQQSAQGALPEGASTFQRALSKQQSVAPNAIAAVYDAYASGKMDPEEAAQFEQDVKSGAVMLPKGASLAGAKAPTVGAAKPEPALLPQAVTDAYTRGQLSEQERADLENDIRNGIVKLPPSAVSQIPGGPNWVAPTEQGVIERPKEPTLGERLVGAGEAGLTTATGMTGGLVGMIGGTVEGITKSIMDGTYGTPEGAKQAEQVAAQRAGQLTYAPRTEQGQEQTQAVGDFMGRYVAPLGPMGAELNAVASGAKAAAPAARITGAAAADLAKQGAAKAIEVAKPPVVAAVEAVKNVPNRAMEMVGLAEPQTTVNTPRASGGAAAVPQDVLRAQKAENLPVPVKLTLGGETRDAAQLAFEKEQMKNPSLGAPLRQRAEENNLQALQNFDTLIDMTEAQSPDLAATGNKVVKSLSEGYKAAKNKTNVAYTKAKNSPEAQAAVDPNAVVSIGEGENAINNSLIGYLNEKVSGVPSAAVPDTARKILIKLGLAEEDANGVLVGKPATVGKMEEFRKELSGTAKWDDRVGVREETILKKLVDAQTEPVAGPLYKEARALRQQQAMKYENRAVVARLITNRKGMDDPLVAVDQVFHKSVVNGSPEEITFLKRVLNTSGEDGKQAWKELQGSMVRYIQDEATKGMGMDSADRPLISPAKLHQTVTALDKNGRLDIVLGKKNAEIVRDLNDVVRYVNTTPPGTLVNNSGTAGTIMAAIAEAGVNGSLLGLPVPVMTGLRMLSKQINNNKMKLKINKALNVKPTEPPAQGKF